MIYLQKMTDAQPVFIPKDGTPVGSMSLELKSNMEKVITIHNVIDLNTSSLYYNVAVSLPSSVCEGEYEYKLTDGVSILSTGLVVIGCTPSVSREYEKEIIKYEQYEI